MLNLARFLAALIYILALPPTTYAGGLPDFKELKARDCVGFDQKQIQRLPSSWFKYKEFVKVCPLRRNLTSPPKIYIISIWTEDFLRTKKIKLWEDFPLSIIVDENFRQLGTLPEIFPMDSRTEPLVYFGKWKLGQPTEIQIDVYDPTVSGDYHYSPLIWDEKDRKYHMIDKEPKYGPRPKR